MQFAVNIAMMFRELPFLDRFKAVATAGFDAVEFWWPETSDRERVADAAATAGVDVIRFALDPGPRGTGLLCDPARTAQFRSTAIEGLKLAAQLDCPMVNALVGTRLPGHDQATQFACGRDNLSWLAAQAAGADVRVLIEANCQDEKPGYLLDRTLAARAFVDEAGHPNVGLLYDVYHMHRSGEDVLATFAEHLPAIAHVQIADAPGRHEPGTGEIDYGYVLSRYHELGYRGYVGLEYRPATTTLDGLGWLPQALRAGAVDPDELAMLSR